MFFYIVSFVSVHAAFYGVINDNNNNNNNDKNNNNNNVDDFGDEMLTERLSHYEPSGALIGLS